MKHSLNFLIFISFFSLSGPLFALSTDREQPITIEADQGQIDDAQGVAIYEGNVIINQGTIRITAAKVTLNYSEQQDIEKVVAVGSPARFRQLPDNKDEYLQASALQMEYFADQDMLQLTQEARVWQAKDVVTGQKITYDTRAGIIRAFKGSGENSRVTVTLQPRKGD
jgi:lipopolysaccharide export system protein LptA